jgi:hypothetical protein
MTRPQLFTSYSSQEEFEQRDGNLKLAIEQLPQADLLNTSEDDLIKRVLEPCIFEVPRIVGEQVYEPREIRVNDTPAFRIALLLQFEGDPRILVLSPSQANAAPSYGEVQGDKIEISYTRNKIDASELRAQMDADIENVKVHLEKLRLDAESFNQSLSETARESIRTRRRELTEAQQAISALGFPVKLRRDAKDYEIPLRRKSISIETPKAGTPAEPYVSAAVYESILDVIRKTALAMERTPSAFRNLGEEDLRWHFIIFLNAIFEGGSTGETFNGGDDGGGKTDILLQSNGRNVFIAECKVWGGEKILHDAIDQLFGYLTWRDTKTAIIIFNRNKDFTAVIETVQKEVPKHPGYVSTAYERREESEFAYIFRHPQDSARQFHVAVLLFDVPRPEKSNGEKE